MFRQNKEKEDLVRKGSRGEVLPEINEGLPDSLRQSGLCPRCGKQSSFEDQGHINVTYDNVYTANRDGSRSPIDLDRVTVLLCRHCNQGTVVVEEKWVADHPAREKASGGSISYRGIHWWPLPEVSVSGDIPEEIASAFTEATKTLYADCPRAAVVMARRTLEAVTVDKGETQGSLFDRLKKLAAKSVLSPDLADWAQEVRLIGNTGAHYDPLNQATLGEASELVGFLRELLRYLYELPAELKRRRTSRLSSPK